MAKNAAARAAVAEEVQTPEVSQTGVAKDGTLAMRDKSGPFFGSICFNCLTIVPVHVNSSGFVVACDDCGMVVRLAGQIERNPDADKIGPKIEAGYECGAVDKAGYFAHHGMKAPKPRKLRVDKAGNVARKQETAPASEA